MSQLSLPNDGQEQQASVRVDLSGFEGYYPLLRALVAVQNESTFYERLHVLLTLARWHEEPPSIQILARTMGVPIDTLPQSLNTLRQAGWLRGNEDDRHYTLTEQGRILIILLQFLAQPWQEGDVTAFATQLYGAADALGLRHDLLAAQFETVLATLEERARKVEEALDAEDTKTVSNRLRESNRDVRIARKALELKQQGATAQDDFDQAQRMHAAISRLTEATARLDIRFQKLLARDLLAQGLVTLGDILEWVREASTEECAKTILPFVKLPFLSIWAVSEFALVESACDVAGRAPSVGKARPPAPVPLGVPPNETAIDQIKQRIYREQEVLRTRLHDNDPLPLPEWVDEEAWQDAVMHFVAALDPELRHAASPVYARLDSEGKLDETLQGAAESVTAGSLSRKAGGQDE